MVEIPLPTISQSLGASVVLAIVYYAYWQLTIGASRRRIIRKHGCKPVKMYPSKDPIFGSDTLRKTLKAVEEHRLLRTSFDRFQTMGNTFQMNLVGTQLIFTIEPEILKTIMSLKFKDYSLGTRRKISMTPVLGEGIFTTDGAAWQHSRDMLRPNFNRSQVGDLPMFETHVSHLIQAIPKDGSMLDLQDLFFQLTIDSATEFLFGESTNCLVPGMRDEKHALFAEKWNKCLEESAKHARTGFMSVFYSRKEFNKNIKFVHEYVEEIVDRVLEQEKTRDVEKSDGRYIFLHELVKQTKNVVELRSELLNILLAGRDTTASLLSNVWFEIARRPDIWAKMRAEVDALNGEKPTFDQIKEMKYIRWVLNESLRLYPVVPGNSREAITDTMIPVGGGPDGKSPVFVPKGYIVGWSPYSMHRRKDMYGEDALEFKPERWDTLRHGWEYLPFNGGPRICIGQQFALTEASYTTVRLMQEFRSIESCDDGPWTEWLTLTCASFGGAKVKLTPF